jgi:membrane-associated phospholipid phosphatase
VTDLETVRPPAPPHSLSGETADELQSLRVRTAARGPGEEANVDFWDAGTCLRWNEYQRDRVAARSVNPPKASRGYAMVSAAMYDAMVAAWDAKFLYLRPRPSAYEDPPTVYGVEHDSPSYVSERAAMSAAAHDVLNFLFPLDTATTDRMLADAMDADLDAGVHFPSDVLAGRTLGEAVAARVIARALADNGQDSFQDSITATYAESGVDGRWRRTPPGNVFPPLLPGWGRVTPWLLESGDAIRPPPPPAYGSDEWNLQRDEVLAAALALSPDRADLATFWADGAGTYTPPGHWNEIACDAATGEGLDECRFARMLAALNTAQADAFVACWECKYFYDVERPVSVIRRDVPGQSGFLSFIETPPFPSYPSGHSTTSGAASQVLGYFFPDFAIDFAVMANEAKDSRLYGGIHFRFDNDTGLDMGRTIGTFSIARLAADGADAP